MVLMLAMCGIARACDGYQDISTDDLKAYRDKLGQADADPLDKFFAFQQLYCSSNPVIRAYAAKYGLQANSDPIVRQQIMLTLLLDMKHFTVQLTPSDQTSADDKAFI